MPTNNLPEFEELRKQLAVLVHKPAALLEFMKKEVYGRGGASRNFAFEQLARFNGSEWNLLEAIETMLQQGHKTRDIANYVLPSIAYLPQYTAEEIIKLLGVMSSEDAAVGRLIPALSSLFQRIPSLGEQCINQVLSANDAVSYPKLEVLARAYGIGCSVNSLDFFLTLTETKSEQKKVCALFGLCEIEPTEDHIVSGLATHAQTLRDAAIAAQNINSYEFLAWRLLCHLSEFDDESRRHIESAAQNGPDVAQQAIAAWIFLRNKPGRRDVDIALLLGPLVSAAMQKKTIRKHVDDMMGALLIDPVTRDHAISACDAFCNSNVNIKLDETFPNVHSSLSSDPVLLSKVSSRWLLRNEISVSSIRSLLFQASVVPELFIPDLPSFINASEKARIRAIRRILGICHHGPAICIFMMAIAKSAELQQWAIDVFSDVFSNYLLLEFPATAKDFLINQAKLVSKKSPLGEVIKKLLVNIRRWEKIIRALPNAKELRPSETKRLAVNAVRIKQMREIDRDAHKRSVFAQFATNFTIKQGHKVVMHIPGQPPQVTTLKKISHSVEIPNSERADPLRGHHQRMLYLKEVK
jgi:hypothetical protein